jgi:hypothetical protein
MKIIFLDIDGVLNVIPKSHDDFGGTFHDDFVENLKHIIDETGAKIVISSSWRFSGLEWMQKMWRFRNLPGEVIDVTTFFADKKLNLNYWDVVRGHEIKVWLDNHTDIENYVILDDDLDMLDEQMNNYVQCSDNKDHPDCIDIGYGLTKKCAEKAIKILNR